MIHTRTVSVVFEVDAREFHKRAQALQENMGYGKPDTPAFDMKAYHVRLGKEIVQFGTIVDVKPG